MIDKEYHDIYAYAEDSEYILDESIERRCPMEKILQEALELYREHKKELNEMSDYYDKMEGGGANNAY